VRLQLAIAQEVVLRLEQARDSRPLASHDETLLCRMKLKLLGLASLTIARQESRLLWLSEGDTPLRFFHVYANARRRRKFIHTLQDDGRTYADEDQKAHLAFTFFNDILGMSAIRTGAINLELLDLPRLDLSQLEQRFTEAKVWEAIKLLPPDKVSGPNGSRRDFYRQHGKSSGWI
jgi:hypothetical protein